MVKREGGEGRQRKRDKRAFSNIALPLDVLQPADDGDGDWAPGMRRSAMSQLKEEEAQV